MLTILKWRLGFTNQIKFTCHGRSFREMIGSCETWNAIPNETWTSTWTWSPWIENANESGTWIENGSEIPTSLRGSSASFRPTRDRPCGRARTPCRDGWRTRQLRHRCEESARWRTWSRRRIGSSLSDPVKEKNWKLCSISKQKIAEKEKQIFLKILSVMEIS